MLIINILLVDFLLLFNIAKCANILVVLTFPGYSQYMLAESLFVRLAERGHHITVIGSYQTNNVPGIRNIVVNYDLPRNMTLDNLMYLQDLTPFENCIRIHNTGLKITEQLLAHQDVQQLINSNEKIDVVLIETFLNEAHHAFAEHFNAHKILFHSMGVSEWNSHFVGNPLLPSYLPYMYAGYTTHMDFTQRFINTLVLWFDRLYKFYVQYPAHQKLINKYFPSKHDLSKVIYNNSLLMTCSHVSTTEALPLTTGIIEVGGLHIKSKELPIGIKNFLDTSENGVVYFSMGTNVKSTSLGKKLIDELMDALGTLKQRVVWKFDDDGIGNVAPNIMISKWFPQNDILAHNNTVLFISHCGLGGTTEAIHHGVPVICIPCFGDQFMNSKRLELFGMAVQLPLKKLSGKTLTDMVAKILNSPHFRENANRRSKIFRDRPMGALDLAVYGVEYVLRHDGAHHLSNSILKLDWYQLYSLDVMATIVFIAFSLCFGIYFVILKLFRFSSLKKLKHD